MPPPSPARAVPSMDLLRALQQLAFPSSSPTKFSRSFPRPLHRTLPITASTRTLSGSIHCRAFTSTNAQSSPDPKRNRYAPKHADRGPKSTEDTQTDFSQLDIFNASSTPQAATSVDACTSDGFHLNNGVKTEGGRGVLLVGGECFTWDPTGPSSSKAFHSYVGSGSGTTEGGAGEGGGASIDARGTLTLHPSTFAVLELLHPRPDLLLLGTGDKLWMLSKATREYLTTVLGVRVDVMDTGNASAAYNLLAQERGVEGGGGVGAALLPLGWSGKGRGR